MDFGLEMIREKIEYIINLRKEDALDNDIILIHIIEVIFCKRKISENKAEKFLDLVFSMLTADKEKRKNIYTILSDIRKETMKKDIPNILNDEEFEDEEKDNVKVLKMNKYLESNCPNELNSLIVDLFNIISKAEMDKCAKDEYAKKVSKFCIESLINFAIFNI